MEALADLWDCADSLRVPNSEQHPAALTIAGSDSGGGAGVQADLKTFAAHGVHGTSAITCVTAQNPTEVRSIQPVDESTLRDQIEAVQTAFSPAAVKIGMLCSHALLEVVVTALTDLQTRIVVDPVMVASSGTRLLATDAVEALKSSMLPLATLITPNLDEASLLLQREIRSESDAQVATRELSDIYGCATLVKGGHRESSSATDHLFDGTEVHEFATDYIPNASTHGSGCTLSAAIAANLALGHSVPAAVSRAKAYMTATIRKAYSTGHHSHLNHMVETSGDGQISNLR